MKNFISSLNLAKMISWKLKLHIQALGFKLKKKLRTRKFIVLRVSTLILTENLLFLRSTSKDWRCAFRAHLTRILNTKLLFHQFSHSIQQFEAISLQTKWLNWKTLRRTTNWFIVIRSLILLQGLKKAKIQFVISTSRMICSW